jgi:tetratricopeptide (TPR) repeat protein/SAM-dependent methyltransferase
VVEARRGLIASVATPRELFDSALASHRSGDLEAAGRLYREVLDAHPEQPDALNLLAAIDMEAEDFGSAAALLRRAIAAAGSVPQYHCNLGNALQGADDLAGAAAAYREAIALQPDYADAYSSLGFVLARMGETAEALECLHAALSIDPDHFFALNNLGDVLSGQGELDDAADAYRRAIAVAPGIAELHTKLGSLLRDLGRLPEAAESLWAAVETGDAEASAYRILGSLLRRSLPSAYDPVLERGLLAFFAATGVDHIDVVDFATELVRLKYAEDGGFASGEDPEFVVHTLLRDPLVQALLIRTVIGDPHLELLLTRGRRRLLLDAADGRQPSLEAASALARQCMSNEYVYSLGEDERAQLGVLKSAIESGELRDGRPDAGLQSTLLHFAMYEPLAGLACAARLAAVPLAAWDEALRPVIRRALHEPLQEVALATGIPTAGRMEDPLSRAVKAQYEENPYPRWMTPAYRTPGNLHGILAAMFPAFEPPDMLRGPVRVLVVGCGTGHHPISIALRYENAEVVATDISRRSLAYAERMAKALDVQNVRFVENDLLDLAALDGEFHAVECVGVLHHTRSIATGLRGLLGKLREDGVMKIGLYSESARGPVEDARARIEELGLTGDADDIRRFREAILAADEHDPRRRILAYGDFYTMSNCRDLLFHVHEQSVTIAAIRHLLRDAGLRFIGFESADSSLAEEYGRLFPGDQGMDDLSRWELVEERDPGAFAGLYQFWCIRNDAGDTAGQDDAAG